MLDKKFVKKLTLEECQEFTESTDRELGLTKTRLERLQKTQENDPTWKAYDKYADDFVGIDIRIEEQYAVFEWLEEERSLLTERMNILTNDPSASLATINPYPSYVKTKKDRERHDAYEKQTKEFEAQGLTSQGYTRSFEGQSKKFYLNNVEITCTVDYEISNPHVEFRGDPNVMTETGYRSHFTNTDLKEFSTIEEMIEGMVAEVMDLIRFNTFTGHSPGKLRQYTLTWEPSLEYLRHSPEQLTLFDMTGVPC